MNGSRRLRNASTLLEVLVVIAIFGVLVGLLLPAVQKVREAASRNQCAYNISQLGLGMLSFESTNGCLPPGIGSFPGPNSGPQCTGFFHLLPFIEQESLHQMQVNNSSPGSNPSIRRVPIKLLICYSDPSTNDNIYFGSPWGVSCYAGNVQVFCKTDSQTGRLQDTWYQRRLREITDGQTNTILFAEKYARCKKPVWGWDEGGNFWAYDETNFLAQPLHPGFAVDWTPFSIGELSKFQIQPNPYATNCDPTLASTPHSSGLPICLADGSVRCLAPGMSGKTWWAACTPASGDALGSEW